VLEHVTTEKAVDLIAELPETVGATVTVHHLFLLFHDVFKGGKIQESHHFCEPVAKGERDREALRRVVLSGNPHFFLGTDSAPHPEDEKRWVGEKQGKPGSFTAPVAYSPLFTLYEEYGHLERSEPFVSEIGPRHYGFEPSTRTVTFVKKPWRVPDRYGDVVPFMAGEILQWQVE